MRTEHGRLFMGDMEATKSEARRLLRSTGLSIRAIAQRVGVSFGTIQKLAVECREEAERCPACGAKVFMPCRACILRAQLRRPSAGREF